LVFAAFSIVVPIIGNGLRAYLIVMLGHLSNMKLAVGVDHLVYGWVFFGIIIFLMFFVGSFWRDPAADLAVVDSDPAAGGVARALAIGALALVAASSGPALAWASARLDRGDQGYVLVPPVGGEQWRASSVGSWDWRPHVEGTDRQFFHTYSDSNQSVGLYIGVYTFQRKGAELVSSVNQMVVERHPVWSERARQVRTIDVGGGPLQVVQRELRRVTGERLLVWNWYVIGSWAGSNAYLAKIRDVWHQLSTGRSNGAVVAIAAPFLESPEQAEAALLRFAGDMEGGIRRAISPDSEAL
jgi:EpsI family protein